MSTCESFINFINRVGNDVYLKWFGQRNANGEDSKKLK